MRHKQKQDIGHAFRGLVVIAGLLAVVMFSSFLIVVSAPDPDSNEERGAIANIIFPGGAGSMVKNEPFSPGKASILSIPAVVGIQNFENLRPDSRVIEYKSMYNNGISRYDHLTTTASISPKKALAISPKKALEFTLVGAKPSGTS